MAQKFKKIILLCTLPLVMWLFFNQVAYWHLHMLENGQVIEHAHPFKKTTSSDTPFQRHHHSDLEYSLFALLSNVAGVLLWAILIAIATHRLLKVYTFSHSDSFIPSAYYSSCSLRGPPSFS